MAKENLPIQFFGVRKVDEQHVEAGGSSEEPVWVLKGQDLDERAKNLMNDFMFLEENIKEKNAEKFNIPFLFKAKLCKNATAKSRRKEIVNLFTINGKSNLLGLSNADEIIIKLDSYKDMNQVSSRIEKYEDNKYAISCLEKIKNYEPLFFQRSNNENPNYKVKLIDFQNYEQNIYIQNLFEKNLFEKNILYTKINYTEGLCIYKLEKVNDVTLDSLEESDIYNALLSLEPMPKYKLSIDHMKKTDDIGPVVIPKNHQDYVTVGILDNGIAPIPQLKPWISDKKWTAYPPDKINPSHGTFVAGVALFGDLCENEDWVGHNGFKLLDATIYPDLNKEDLEEDELIENIKEAVKDNYKNVKIWNLSISIKKEVKDYKFSDLAIALDNLQDKYNVLICKSAGNCDGFIKNRIQGRIHEGADSVRSLVVGSVAHKSSKFDYALPNNPSPFSRIGPGPEYIIKPEISHYGGNAGLNNNGKLTTTGIKSFSSDGKVALDVGTSFSTPRITALAAGIYQGLNEEFNPLLIKALIIHSATYSNNLQIPITERTKYMGFGIPQKVSDIIYNNPNEITLILKGNLQKGEYYDIMDFPMPECLIKDGFYTGQIIATLVYNPILDYTQGIEYCQSNIDVKLGSYDEKSERDITKRNILNPVGRKGSQNIFSSTIYSKSKIKEFASDFSLRERLLIQYGDKYYPVKKYAVDLSELTPNNKLKYLGGNKRWYLHLKGLFRDHIEKKYSLTDDILSQDFCLIVTIRDPSGKEQVYNGTSQKLDAYHFWHHNIKISNTIKVSI